MSKGTTFLTAKLTQSCSRWPLHDDEEEQHHDGTGVHDHLHRSEELGILRDERHRDAEQRGDQTECGMAAMTR